MLYTDIVFYSSDPEVNLYQRMADEQVSGVFIAARKELDDALAGLADTIIGKAVDLNHMRGIAMAEVSEMDLLMETTLVNAFQNTNNSKVRRVVDRTKSRLLDSTEKDLTILRQHLESKSLSEIVEDSRKFTSLQKYFAINRLAKELSALPSEVMQVFREYQKEILENRNKLAHVSEKSVVDGNTVLLSVKDGVEIVVDELWMNSFRVKLRTQRNALECICNAIQDQF